MTKKSKSLEEILSVDLDVYKQRMSICAYCSSYKSNIGGVCAEGAGMMPDTAKLKDTVCKLLKWKV